MEVNDVLDKLQNVQRTVSGWSAKCPVHEDNKNSLSVSTGDDGRILFHCHAQCATEEINSAIGIKMRDLFDGSPILSVTNGTPKQRRIVATYDYCDEQGELLYQGVRYEPKGFSQRQPNPKGVWTWNMKGARRVPYNLPKIINSGSQDIVFVVEGEKDCDRLAGLGLLATSNVGGAGKWLDEYSQYLAGRHIVVIPDNDEPGRKHANQVAHSLNGIAASIRIITLPNLPAKGDVSDYIDVGGTVEKLIRLAQSAPIWSPLDSENPEKDFFVGFDSSLVHTSDENDWPEPEEIQSGLLPVPHLEIDLIPPPLRAWLTDIADRVQCSLEFPTIGALVGVASIIGNQVGIRPKQKDDWTVIPNIWGAIVGRPGLLKSPSLSEALKPVHSLASKAREAHSQAVQEYEIEDMLREARRKKLQDDINKAIKNGSSPDVRLFREQLFELENISEPIERRYIVNDPTVEKLGELLNQNPRGLLLFRDELVGWFRSLDKDGRENDRAFYLEAWNGDGQYTYDRIGRGTIHINSMALSILGGIQPGPLSQYLRSALSGGKGDDGLLQRFQLLVYPNVPKGWRNVDRWPDTEAKNRVFEMCDRLDKMNASVVGATLDEHERIPYLRFTDGAQEFFNQWRGELEQELRREGNLHPALEAQLSKYRSLMPTLALLFHLLSWADKQVSDGQVSLEVAELAAAWCSFLFSHAKRIYGLALDGELVLAQQLAKHIRSGDLLDPFTNRDVYRKNWSGLSTNKLIVEPLAILEEFGWIRAKHVREQGRPTTLYSINPRIQRAEGK